MMTSFTSARDGLNSVTVSSTTGFGDRRFDHLLEIVRYLSWSPP